MSVRSTLPLRGLARDVGAIAGGEGNALRRAENVVLRSEGVIETRPSFGDVVYENQATEMRVRALREFRGVPLAVMQLGTTDSPWFLFNLATGTPLAELDAAPVDPTVETKFAESRNNLYFTSKLGVQAQEDPTLFPRASGVPMQALTDLAAAAPPIAPATPSSCAYRYVFVRKDSNGYVRRSPPSARIVCTALGVPQTFASATKVYLPSMMQAGDRIEFYRSRTLPGMSPRPEHFLALTYTITAADVAAGFAGPIADTTIDNLLGAELYTDASQAGALGAKFPPPQAQSIAWWQRVMWYGRVQAPTRLELDLQALYFAGIPTYSPWQATGPSRGWGIDPSFAPGLAHVADTNGLEVGMIVTDNLREGPSVFNGPDAESYVPANSHITAIVPNVSVTINAPFDFLSAPATIFVQALPPEPVNGLMAGTTLGDAIVGDTRMGIRGNHWRWLRPGMWISYTSVPEKAPDFYLPQDTRIVSIDPVLGWIYLSKPALRTGSAVFYAGDIVTVNGVEMFCVSALTSTPDGSVSPPLLGIGVTNGPVLGDAIDQAGPFSAGVAMQGLSSLINSTFFGSRSGPTATPLGDTWDLRDVEYDVSGLRQDPGTIATSIELEYDGQITVRSTAPAAFTGMTLVPQTIVVPPSISGAGGPVTFDVGQLTASEPPTPHRLYFSDLDEPESVPLLNYIDVGAAGQPILALVPLRNALLVFKSDGLWRVTGSGPTGWSVEPLDPTIHLVRPEAVTVLRNIAYAWCVGGFYAITENGAQSISQNKLDVELREVLGGVDARTSGFVVGSLQRNLVIFGVPFSPVQDKRPRTLRAYAYHTVTQQWSEWPISWTHAAESVSDTLYVARPESFADGVPPAGSVAVEVRAMSPTYDGIDRTYALGPSIDVTGTSVTILVSDAGTWSPVVGDWISATDGTTRFYRRITAVSRTHGPETWHLTLEAEVTSEGGLLITDAGDFFVTDTGFHFRISDLSGWQAHEAIVQKIEWHPVAPAGIPVGTLAREMQFQLDLRDAPDPELVETLPKYVAGGTSDLNAFATVTSAMARVPQVQPLRVGVSRQVARSASLAAYLELSDLFAQRVVGASIVFEGTSERTRR